MATLGYIFLALIFGAVLGVVWYVRMLRKAFASM